MAWRPTLRRGNALDVHRIIIFQEDDAHLRQPPPRQLLDLWRDIGSQGDCADEEPVLTHGLEPVGTRGRPGFSLALRAAFSAATA